MATDKTFTWAGVSILQGETKVRFANDAGRVKVLEKNEHTGIRLVETGSPMTKAQACRFLHGHADFQDQLAQDAIATYVKRNAPDVAKALGMIVEPAPSADGSAPKGKRGRPAGSKNSKSTTAPATAAAPASESTVPAAEPATA